MEDVVYFSRFFFICILYQNCCVKETVLMRKVRYSQKKLSIAVLVYSAKIANNKLRLFIFVY